MPCINQSICDLIESIALQETALSHILNAEGEKLQHAIKMANNICELIEIDNSVQMTINNVMLLENVLYTKTQYITKSVFTEMFLFRKMRTSVICKNIKDVHN